MKVDSDDILDLISREGTIDRAILTPNTRLDELEIPSLELINILFALEDRYHVAIETEEMQDAKTIQDLINLVMTRVQQASDPA